MIKPQTAAQGAPGRVRRFGSRDKLVIGGGIGARNGRRDARMLLGLVLLGACGGVADQSATGQRRDRVRVVMQPWLAHAALYIGEAEGYFAEQGIDVEFVNMANTETAVPLLVTGQVDVLPGQAAPGLLNAIARGAPIRMVAEKGHYAASECSSLALVARRGLITGPGDRVPPHQLKRLSVDPQAGSLYFVEKALQSAGIELSTLKQVSVPALPEIEALGNGSLDIALTGEPFLTRTLHSGNAVLWLGSSQVLPDEEFSFIFFGTTLLRHRALGERFLTAYLKSVQRYLEGKTERNVEVVARATGEDPALLRQACWPTQRADGSVVLDHVMRFQEWAHHRGLIDNVVPADQLWDGGFIDAANHKLAATSNP